MQITKRDAILKRISFFVCCFIIYSFIGWVYEACWDIYNNHRFIDRFLNRGFLHGFYLPVYGFGALILYGILHKLMKKKMKVWKINVTPIIIFILILLIVSVIELFASYLLEYGFGIKLWDYSYDFLNFQGRISLRNGSLLALGGMLFLYGVQPLLEKTVGKLPTVLIHIFSVIILIVMGTDLVLTLIH